MSIVSLATLSRMFGVRASLVSIPTGILGLIMAIYMFPSVWIAFAGYASRSATRLFLCAVLIPNQIQDHKRTVICSDRVE